jgi:hypothetical protein
LFRIYGGVFRLTFGPKVCQTLPSCNILWIPVIFVSCSNFHTCCPFATSWTRNKWFEKGTRSFQKAIHLSEYILYNWDELSEIDAKVLLYMSSDNVLIL